METKEAVKAYWQLEIRAVKGRTIRGKIYYRKLSQNLGNFYEYLEPGCFSESLRSGRNVYLLWSHDSAKPLASTASGTLEIKDTKTALEFSAKVPDTQQGRDALEMVKSGIVKDVSFGFIPELDSWSVDEGEDIRAIQKAQLDEISLVIFPAYEANFAEGRNLRNQKQDFKNFFCERKNRRKSKMKQSNLKKADDLFSGTFRNNSEYLKAVIWGSQNRGQADLRLQRSPSGLSEKVMGDGGFLVTKNLMDGFLYGETASELYRRCAKYPVREGAFQIDFPTLSETSRAEGSAFGGLRLHFEGEADDVTTAFPKFRVNKLELKKAIGVCPITDELMQDGPRMERFLTNVFGQALRYTIDKSILRGTGSGQPLGLLNAPGTLEIAKEAGQDVDTVVTENVLNMVAALPADSHQNACWVVNPEILPQLQKLHVTSGTGGAAVPLWKWRAGGELYNKFCGFDCIPNEHCSALGDKGDIFLADFSRYVVIEKEIRQTISAHLYFLSGESAFRLVYRFDGQPMVNAPITPAHGASGAKISPFVTLAERS